MLFVIKKKKKKKDLIFETGHSISYKITYALSEVLDQLMRPCSLNSLRRALYGSQC